MENNLIIGLRNMLLVQIMMMSLILFQDSLGVPRSLRKGLAAYKSWKSRGKKGETGKTSGQFCEIDMLKFK
jgi:hypothetical protein